MTGLIALIAAGAPLIGLLIFVERWLTSGAEDSTDYDPAWSEDAYAYWFYR